MSAASKCKFLKTREDVQTLIDKYNTFIFDCDGVLWHYHHTTPFAKETLSLLLQRKKKILFFTNHSNVSRTYLVQKLKELFDIDFPQSQCYSAGSLVASSMKKQNVKKVYFIGSSFIKQDLLQNSFEVIDASQHDQMVVTEEMHEKFLRMASVNRAFSEATMGESEIQEYNTRLSELPKELISEEVGEGGEKKTKLGVDAIISSYDGAFNMYKVNYAYLCSALNPKCILVTPNKDKVDTSKAIPGNVCQVKGLETALGKKAFIVGKPNIEAFNIMDDDHQLKREETIMIGDTLNSDMQFAMNSGIHSLMVLTGNSKVEGITETVYPTYISNTVGDLYSLLTKEL